MQEVSDERAMADADAIRDAGGGSSAGGGVAGDGAAGGGSTVGPTSITPTDGMCIA